MYYVFALNEISLFLLIFLVQFSPFSRRHSNVFIFEILPAIYRCAIQAETLLTTIFFVSNGFSILANYSI